MFANTFNQLMLAAFSMLILAAGSATAMDAMDSMEKAADQMIDETFGGENMNCRSPDYEGDRNNPDDPCYMMEEDGEEDMDRESHDGYDHHDDHHQF